MNKDIIVLPFTNTRLSPVHHEVRGGGLVVIHNFFMTSGFRPAGDKRKAITRLWIKLKSFGIKTRHSKILRRSQVLNDFGSTFLNVPWLKYRLGKYVICLYVWVSVRKRERKCFECVSVSKCYEKWLNAKHRICFITFPANENEWRIIREYHTNTQTQLHRKKYFP